MEVWRAASPEAVVVVGQHDETKMGEMREALLLLSSMGLQFSVTLMIGFVGPPPPREGRRERKKVDFLSWSCLPSFAVAAARRLNARHSGRKHSGESSGKRHTFGLGSLVRGFTARLVWQPRLSMGVFWVVHISLPRIEYSSFNLAPISRSNYQST